MFFTTPDPLDMPQAEGWLVTEDNRSRIEDRFDVDDLWYSRTVAGCWLEDGGNRVFTLADLEFLPPSLPGKMTRAEYEGTLVRPERRDHHHLLRQLCGVSPVEPSDEFTRPSQLPRGMKEVRYYEGTNASAIVCAFRPEDCDHWRAAIWELAEGDDREEMRKLFEDMFWDELAKNEKLKVKSEKLRKADSSKRKRNALSERELLKRDAAHSVASYDNWHCSPGEDFVILDDLRDDRGFIASLTNDLAVWRGRFAAAMPTVIDTTNALSVARIYRIRADYLVAAGEDMQWSAAYWNPSRRELVACLPPDGDRAELRKTIRHEAFHQYLSYATAFIATSPWINEGYAQYFENGCNEAYKLSLTEEQWNAAELALPALMLMDYSQFYAGTDGQRRSNYRIAWSIAYFMENGMREISHDPFKDMKRRYFEAHAKTKDMRKATLSAFESEDQLKLFCNEWKKFWKNHQ